MKCKDCKYFTWRHFGNFSNYFYGICSNPQAQSMTLFSLCLDDKDKSQSEKIIQFMKFASGFDSTGVKGCPMIDCCISDSNVEKEVIQITMRNVPLALHNRIRQEAEDHKRSMNNELLFVLERYFLELDRDKKLFREQTKTF